MTLLICRTCPRYDRRATGQFFKEKPEDEHLPPDPHNRRTQEELFVQRRA